MSVLSDFTDHVPKHQQLFGCHMFFVLPTICTSPRCMCVCLLHRLLLDSCKCPIGSPQRQTHIHTLAYLNSVCIMHAWRVIPRNWLQPCPAQNFKFGGAPTALQWTLLATFDVCLYLHFNFLVPGYAVIPESLNSGDRNASKMLNFSFFCCWLSGDASKCAADWFQQMHVCVRESFVHVCSRPGWFT